MKFMVLALALMVSLIAADGPAKDQSDLDKQVEHGYANSDGVKIHYARIGPKSSDVPLIIMIHGFPDFWYTWRYQMEALSSDHQVVAIDQRGYNLSDKPKGVDNYSMRLLMGDVVAVIRHFKRDKAIIVGHDWGGAVAWQLAINRPDVVEKLIILNLPHPRGLTRELAKNPRQQKNSQYASDFQQEGAHLKFTAEGLASWVKDPNAKAKYIEAFRRSDFEAMLNYYKRNFPRRPAVGNSSATASAPPPLIKVKAPVLMFHGLDDSTMLPSALNDTWEWLEQDLTLVTIPNAGHFVQQDASDLVTRTMKMWLKR